MKTTETVPDQKVRAAILPVGDTAVELLEGPNPTRSFPDSWRKEGKASIISPSRSTISERI